MKFNWKKKITNCYTAHYDDYLKTSTDSFMWIFQKTDINSLYVTLHFFLTVLKKKAFGGKNGKIPVTRYLCKITVTRHLWRKCKSKSKIKDFFFLFFLHKQFISSIQFVSRLWKRKVTQKGIYKKIPYFPHFVEAKCSNGGRKFYIWQKCSLKNLNNFKFNFEIWKKNWKKCNFF